MSENASPATMPGAADWQTLSRLRVAFGHQSVGSNIMAGLETLAREQGARVPILETREIAETPGVRHFNIGRNEEPDTKLRDFEATMAGGMAAGVDVALMKLCYIDFNAETDANRLAAAYIDTIERLSAQFPLTVFVPVTAPLTTVQTGPKAWIKKGLGRTPSGYEENARRMIFNQTLRQHFGAGNLLFDLAAVESGSGRTGVDYGGRQVEALDPSITDDGGHLNAEGQRRVAGALVHHLGTVGRRSS